MPLPEELLGLYQRILFQMDKVLKESQSSSDSVFKAYKHKQLSLLFEILAPYGGTSYDIEKHQYVMQHYSGEYIQWNYAKEQATDERRETDSSLEA